MSNVLTDDGVSQSLGIVLHGGRDVAYPCPRFRLGYAQLERLSGGLDKALSVIGDLAHAGGESAVAMKAPDYGPHVHTDDVAISQRSVAGDTVHYLFVY